MSEWKSLVKGIISFIPGTELIPRREGGGANYARYCYSVWLRHLVVANQNGFVGVPKILAELGPGDSLGIGLAALLSGTQKYYAFDVIRFVRKEENKKMLIELVELFRSRTPIPSEDEFPLLSPKISSYDFPHEILTDNVLEKTLSDSFIHEIAESINRMEDKDRDNQLLSYYVPWNSDSIIVPESVDFILSQAVLEHVDNINLTYEVMKRWLRNGGYGSHQIDFKSHGYSKEWAGHWYYSDFKWKIIRGRRPYLLNREPLSSHVRTAEQKGFSIKCIIPKISEAADRSKLSARFKQFTEDDLKTSSAYLLIKKEDSK